MPSYTTVTEAVQDLTARGYTENFSLESDHLSCPALSLKLNPSDFEVNETYRFEGETDPADEAVVYGIESKDGVKGIMVNAYGTYADTLSADLVKKLA